MQRSSICAAAAFAAGCASAGTPVPADPGAMYVAPPVAPEPWWSAGDASCPALHGAPAPGGPPGTSVTIGRVVGTPQTGDVHCDAGGVAHGPATRFFPGGRPAETGVVDHGYRTGTWTSWHSNGNVARQETYVGATRTGTFRAWYPSGTPSERGELTGDRRVGIWLRWDDDGGPAAEADRWTKYDDRGRERGDGVVDDGEMIKGGLLCVVGRSYPRCRVVLIGDIGIRNAPSDATEPGTSRADATLELGAIVNIDRRHGVGLTGGWVFDATFPATTVRGRYRYWLTSYLAAEGVAGILRKRGNESEVGATGVSLEGALTLGDVIGLTATIERYEDGEVRTLVGARIGLQALLTAAYVALSVVGHAK